MNEKRKVFALAGVYIVVGALCAAALAAGGCKEEPRTPPWEAPKSAYWVDPSVGAASGQTKPFAYDPAAEYEALVKTSMGEFRLGFYPRETPLTVAAFVSLAARRFYDKLLVYRVKAGEFIETGDHENTGSGITRVGVKGEFTDRQFVAGTVGLARKAPPDSGSTMWFVCLTRKPEWDGKYAAFGYVKEGLDVVRKISEVPVQGDLAVLPVSRQRPVDLPVIQSIEIVKVSEPGQP